MFHQMQQAIEPPIALKQIITDWGIVCRNLSEASRKRRPQMESYVPLG
jgi:hypothetical protein